MKKIILSIFILIMVSGCWNYNELNNYSIATGMAIDYIDDDKYKVSFLISNGKKIENQSSNSQYQSVLYSGEGITIYEAIKNIGLISPKQLYIGHLNSIVVSEEVARKGLYDSLEFLLEDSQSKKNFYVVLAKDSTAKEVLSITSPMTDFSSESISNNIASSHKLQGSIISKTYNDIIYELVNDGIDTAISSYIIVGDKEKGMTLDNLESVEPKSYIKLDNLGIFKGDKLVAWADKDISSGINIINNDVTELYVNTDCDGGHIVINTTDLNTKRDVSKDKIRIKTTGTASISEVTCNINLKDKDNIDKLKEKVNNEIKNMIKDGYMFARDNGSDVFGFGLSFYKNNPNEYKSINWYEVYSKIEPEINVDVTLKSSGNLKQSEMRIANEKYK